MADKFKIYKALPEDLPTFTTIKDDLEGIGADITVDSVNHYLVSYIDSSKNVKFIKSEDCGQTWSNPVLAETEAENCQTGIEVDMVNRVFLSFVKKISGISKICYKISKDVGETWDSLVETNITI